MLQGWGKPKLRVMASAEATGRLPTAIRACSHVAFAAEQDEHRQSRFSLSMGSDGHTSLTRDPDRAHMTTDSNPCVLTRFVRCG